jgi:hypothetical protein
MARSCAISASVVTPRTKWPHLPSRGCGRGYRAGLAASLLESVRRGLLRRVRHADVVAQRAYQRLVAAHLVNEGEASVHSLAGAQCSRFVAVASRLFHKMLDFLPCHLISLHHLFGHLAGKDIRKRRASLALATASNRHR